MDNDYQSNQDSSGSDQGSSYNYGQENSYEQGTSQSYGSYGQPSGQPVPKKKNKVLPVIFLIIGAVLLVMGFFSMFMAESAQVFETADPVDVYFATDTDEYSYALIQYMTESVAYYEAIDKVQFYITFDKDWNPAVICVHDGELPLYQPYIDWLYSDSYENEPEEMTVTGYAQPFDQELIDLVIEGFEYIEPGLIDESNFYDWFGYYYLQIGQKNSSYETSNLGIYLILIAVALIALGGFGLYDKNAMQTSGTRTYQNGPDIIPPTTNVGLGIIGALIGALLGGIVFTVIEVMGYISGWVGILIFVFADMGYKILSKKEDLLGKVISLILGLVTIAPATYLAQVWWYYQGLNESMGGYTSLGTAFVEYANYMTKYNEWSVFYQDVILGYVFVALMGFFWIFGYFGHRKRGRESKK